MIAVDGRLVELDGITSFGPGAAPWVALEPRDYRARPRTWIRQWILHTTQGRAPQRILPGRGAPGGARATLDYWRVTPEGRAKSSAAHLVVDRDGTVFCAADLVRAAAHHAEWSNAWSVGLEMWQSVRGEIYQATLDATAVASLALCEQLGIPPLVPHRYDGRPIARMLRGGQDMVGIFGHRDNTYKRGLGDPGDVIFDELVARGALRVDFTRRSDLELVRAAQRRLVELGARLVVDGVFGPATAAAARAFGGGVAAAVRAVY